jgi:hypothetical protein
MTRNKIGQKNANPTESDKRPTDCPFFFIYIFLGALWGVASPSKCCKPKEPSKQITTDLDVVGWFLRGQKSTRVSHISLRFFYRVCQLPLPRNAQKRTKSKCQEETKVGLVGSSEFNQIHAKVRRFFFEGSLCKCKPVARGAKEKK